jgi:hypothetical protein
VTFLSSGNLQGIGFDWPVDGHVHFHTLARVASTLDSAAANFRNCPGRCQAGFGALLLAQGASERIFEALTHTRVAGRWRLAAPRDEPETLIASCGSARIAIVCGRQVRAVDGLEVLALGTCKEFSDRMDLLEAIAAVRESGALAVVPWGFGKWLGERGRRVERALESLGPESVFIGDNGSRLALTGMPSLVRELRGCGFRVLPGTDPFPLPGGQQRVGRFGFMAGNKPSESAPWRALRSWLQQRQDSPLPYGRALTPLAFVVNQVGIQLYNLAARKHPA